MTDNRPEAIFQKHIARYLEKQQGYTVLEAAEISDKDFYLVEPVLLGFLKATQADTLKALEANYGSGAFTEIISVLKGCNPPSALTKTKKGVNSSLRL